MVLNNVAERDEFYKTETKRLLDAIPENCIAPVWDYDYCELEKSFVGFIDQYAQLRPQSLYWRRTRSSC